MTSLPAKDTLFATAADAPSTAVTVPAEVIVSLNWKAIVCPVPINRDSTVMAPVIGTPVTSGSENVPAAPWTFRDTTLTRESATAAGVTATLAEAGPVPSAFVAVTVQLYKTPFVSIGTIIGELLPVAEMPLQLTV